MSDYIEREAAINAVFSAMADGRAVFPALNNLPAADVRPVKRGKWIISPGGRTVNCSACGRAPIALLLSFKYCPICGAEMEEADGT